MKKVQVLFASILLCSIVLLPAVTVAKEIHRINVEGIHGGFYSVWTAAEPLALLMSHPKDYYRLVICNAKGSEPVTISGGESLVDLTKSPLISMGDEPCWAFNITVKKPGAATLNFRAANGDTAVRKLVIQDQLDFAQQVKSDQKLPTNDCANLGIVGGTPPYKIKTSDSRLKTAGEAAGVPCMYTLTPGTFSTTVSDASGKSVTKTFTFILKQELTALKLKIEPDTIVAGHTTATLTVTGGTAPFTVRAPTDEVSVSGTGPTYVISGLHGTALAEVNGKAKIWVTDSKGNSTYAELAVQADPDLLPSMSLLADSVKVGQSVTVTIKGGKPPYTLTDQTNCVSPQSTASNNKWMLKGIKAGIAAITVRDSRGGAASTAVKVIAALSASLNPTAITIGGTAALTAGGGTAPYTATESVGIVSLKSEGSAGWVVKGLKAGSTSLSVKDAAGESIKVAMTVSKPLPFSLDRRGISGAVRMGVGETIALQFSGGVTPYTVTEPSGILRVYSVRVYSGPLTWNVEALKAGSTSVIGKDATGATETIQIIVTKRR